jgi:hypothetical protein
LAQKRAVLAIILLVGTVLIHTYAQTNQNPTPTPTASSSTAPLTNKDVLELVKAQLPADVIIAKIQGSPCSFDTSPSALKDLKSAAVPDAVIVAMVKSSAGPPNKPGPGVPNHGKSLWISKFTCQAEAAAAVAAVQKADLAALRQSSLFGEVSSFATDSEQPEGTWRLSAKEISYARGNAAERSMIGWGSGRAHLVMAYELRDPSGAVVWKQQIKTEPPFWSSSGETGGIQDQKAAMSEQPGKLLDALSKFFTSRP